jgi:hypothetical protein
VRDAEIEGPVLGLRRQAFGAMINPCCSMRRVHPMRYLLLLCALLVILFASDRRLIAQTSQTVAPPPAPTLLPLTATSTACLTSCDTVAMNCQVACIPVVSTTTTVPAPGACNNACITQQLVCKQGCSR